MSIVFICMCTVCIFDLYFLQRVHSSTVFVDIRQLERIVRPLVPGTLFRASSLGTRGARNTERKRRIASRSRGTFASSPNKYLRQSSRPYLAALHRHHSLPHQISFFLRRNISRCLCDHICRLYCRFLFRLSRRFHFVEKKSKTVEVSS